MPPLPSEASVNLPTRFFTEILPQITDLAELRLILAMYQRTAAGQPIVAERGLTSDPLLRRGLVPVGSARDPGDELRRALERSLTRGALLALTPADPDDERRWYILSTPDGRELVEALESGRRGLADFVTHDAPEQVVATQPNIFRLYERHIAVLTPSIAQQLAEAAEQYPCSWINDAFVEAVARDRRSWRFIRYLLERWMSEGKDHATHRRLAARPLDPNKYTKGKYAALFRG